MGHTPTFLSIQPSDAWQAAAGILLAVLSAASLRTAYRKRKPTED